MLNVFPELLTYSFLAPFILRVVVGLIFIDLGILKFRGEKAAWENSFNTLGLKPADLFLPVYAVLEIAGGLMLIGGAYTQIASLFFVISTLFELYVEWKAGEILKRDIVFYMLVLVICISLLITGAGAYAVDIPL